MLTFDGGRRWDRNSRRGFCRPRAESVFKLFLQFGKVKFSSDGENRVRRNIVRAVKLRDRVALNPFKRQLVSTARPAIGMRSIEIAGIIRAKHRFGFVFGSLYAVYTLRKELFHFGLRK